MKTVSPNALLHPHPTQNLAGLLLISLIVFGPVFTPIQVSASGAAKAPVRLTREELRGYLRAEAKLLKQPMISLDDFEAKVTGGPRQYYSPDAVQNYLDSYKAA